MIDYDSLIDLRAWCKGGTRQVEITLGGPLGAHFESIHVYDFELREGQNIVTVADIDLIGRKKRKIENMKKKIEQLEMEVAESEREHDNSAEVNENSNDLESPEEPV